MSARPAEVRFYIDADVLGLGHVLASLRNDVTYPGDAGATIHRRERPPCPVTSPKAKDVEWLPVVAEHGWVAITRDIHISQHSAEIASVKEHGVCLVAISGPEGKGTWEQLEIVMTQWRAIEALHGLPGPWIYTVTRTSLKKLDLT